MTLLGLVMVVVTVVLSCAVIVLLMELLGDSDEEI